MNIDLHGTVSSFPLSSTILSSWTPNKISTIAPLDGFGLSIKINQNSFGYVLYADICLYEIEIITSSTINAYLVII